MIRSSSRRYIWLLLALSGVILSVYFIGEQRARHVASPTPAMPAVVLTPDASAAPNAAIVSAPSMPTKGTLFALSPQVEGTTLRLFGERPVRERAARRLPKGRVVEVLAGTVPDFAEIAPGETLNIPLPDGRTWAGHVNLSRQDKSGAPRRWLAGGWGDDTGGFTLVQDAATRRTRGQFWRLNEPIAYLVDRDATGRTMVSEILLEDLYCSGVPYTGPIQPQAAVTPLGGGLPPDPVPVLRSRPDATAVIFLDFDGTPSETFANWPNNNPGQTFATTRAALTSAQIEEVWKIVAEDYAAFNIDVTTVEARYTGAAKGARMRCIVTPTLDGDPLVTVRDRDGNVVLDGSGNPVTTGTTGRAGIGSFAGAATGSNDEFGSGVAFEDDVPCWGITFTYLETGGIPAPQSYRTMATMISHELGHTFGLFHDSKRAVGTAPFQEYWSGHGTVPITFSSIMGDYRNQNGGRGPVIAQWSKQEYASASSNMQDDMAIISGTPNNVGYAPDTETFDIQPISFSGAGTIHRGGDKAGEADVDSFTFTAPDTGTMTALVRPPERFTYAVGSEGTNIPNLDPLLRLTRADGSLLAEAAAGTNLQASLSAMIEAGTTYVLEVRGNGRGNAQTNGYSNYASVGRYVIEGTLPDNTAPDIAIVSPMPCAIDAVLPSVSGKATDDGTGVDRVELALRNDAPGDGRWFDWTTETFSGTTLQARHLRNITVEPDGTWASVLPSVPALATGEFSLHARGRDLGANVSDFSIRSFFVLPNGYLATLTWDPGTDPVGTLPYTRTHGPEGCGVPFRIITQDSLVGGWRTVVHVTSGAAKIYLKRGSVPTVHDFEFSATGSPGDQGILLSSAQFSPGEEWFILVESTAGAQWSLLSGEIFVNPLGSLAFMDADGDLAYDDGETIIPTNTGAVSIGGEGAAFFRTSVPNGVPAWAIWLATGSSDVLLRKGAVPFRENADLTQLGRMLVVPDYLQPSSAGGTYFIRVDGAPGSSVTLDSRIHTSTPLAFNSTNVTATGSDAGYRTFRVTVPIDQIGWEVSVAPNLPLDPGGPVNTDFSVRRDKIPNEFEHDAASAVPTLAIDSLTLAPPGLTNGSFFVTIWGGSSYTAKISSGNPTVPVVPFAGININDQPDKVGWRYYVVTDLPSQIGLGWELLLAGAPAGTEIALRRNALPARWRGWNGSSYAERAAFLDFSSLTNILQRPGHQADVWYIGIYNPDEGLGTFTHTRRAIPAPTIAFNGGTRAIVSQPSDGAWRYVRIDLPADAAIKGWDLQVRNVSGGTASVALQKDSLPGAPASGFSFGIGTDWTLYPVNSNGTLHYGAVLPIEGTLVAGTYYLGVLADSSAISYEIQSRGIGAGYAIPVDTLSATTGSTQAISGLAARESKFYKLTLPAGLASLEITADPTAGDVSMAMRKDRIPGITTLNPLTRGIPAGGVFGQKPGLERFVFLPQNGETALAAGDYYVAVISEGLNPQPETGSVGSGSANATLRNAGPLAITPLGQPTLAGVSHNFTLLPGQIKAVEFTIPAGLLGMELRLTAATGDAAYAVNDTPGAPLPFPPLLGGWVYYGHDGGQSSIVSQDVFTQPEPVAGVYRVMFAAPSLVDGASGTFTVKLPEISVLAFAGGTASVVSQTPNTWRYFQVVVPNIVAGDPLGWDLRLTGIDQSAGSAQVQIRRDALPPGGEGVDGTSTAWPTKASFGVGADWTGANVSASGEGHLQVVLPMGQPLEPGTYYVGVFAQGTISYTIHSRAVLKSEVTTLANTAAASQEITDLAPWDIQYFKTTVPAGQPSWEWSLDPSLGDVLLAVRRGGIPGSSGISQGGEAGVLQGVLMSKTGGERFTLLPPQGEANVPAGEYFLAVVSLGQDPSPGQVGTGTSSATLTNEAVLDVPNLGTAGTSPMTTGFTLEPGQIKAVDFQVPPGAAALQIRILPTAGDPHAAYFPVSSPEAAPGTVFPVPPDWPFDSYGYDGGHFSNGSIAVTSFRTLSTVATPAMGTYRVVLRNNGATEMAAGSLEIVVLGVQDVVFNGGSATMTNQPVETWAYFRVVVPNLPTGVSGWDLRVTEVTDATASGAEPAAGVFIRRDEFPPGTTFVDGNATSWPTGASMRVGVDWTRFPRNPGGALHYGATLPFGSPLEAGEYFIGVRVASAVPISYRVESRGIGAGQMFQVTPLDMTGPGSSTTTVGLGARNGRFYRIPIPAGRASWEVLINPVAGDVNLAVARDHIPGLAAASNGLELPLGRTLIVQKLGAERFVLLPFDNEVTIPEGEYFITVISQGLDSGQETLDTIGSGPVSVNVSNGLLPVTALTPTVNAAGPSRSITLEGGQIQAFTFTVAPMTPLVEIRLDDRVMNPGLALQSMVDGQFPYPFTEPFDVYGFSGGWGAGSIVDRRILLFPPPAAGGTFRLLVRAGPTPGGYEPASATLQLRTKQFDPLAFGPLLSGGSVSHTVTRSLTSGEKIAFRVQVPTTYGGQPVIGWELTLSSPEPAATLTAYPILRPDERIGGGRGATLLVPPFLVPGEAYAVEVSLGDLAGNVTVTSNPILLTRTAFTMPVAAGVEFGDTGAAGIDLGEGAWHYYAIDVPEGNAGVMRTQLDAINGNPDVFLRYANVPTTAVVGGFDHSLQGPGMSQIGNWVPTDGRVETQLSVGRWYLAVNAVGTNCRYRLRLATGQVTPLAINGGAVNDVPLISGDWKYFRVSVPENAPTSWTVNFSRTLGDAVLYVRDTVPPGEIGVPNDSRFYRDWSTDGKNVVVYPTALAPGTQMFTLGQFRPGHVYYLGVVSPNDATFSLTTSTAGGPLVVPAIPWNNGSFSGTLAAQDILLKTTAPIDATFLRYAATHSEDIVITIEEGAPPIDGHYASTGADSAFTTGLSPLGWPWVPGHTFYIRLHNNSAVPQPVSFALANVPDPAIIAFSEEASSTLESGMHEITLVRTGGTAGSAQVTVNTLLNGTAGAGDFTALQSHVVTFANEELAATVGVKITADLLDEADETFSVVIAPPGQGVSLGAITSHVVTILDDDIVPLPGSIRFDAAASTSPESGVFTVGLTRSNGSSGTVSVPYAFRAGTAIAGTDFTSTVGNVEFAEGVTTATLTIPITSDVLDEADETFFVDLGTPTGGATLGTIITHAVTITDDDNAGSISFNTATSNAPESGNFAVSLTRSGGTDGAVSVSYTFRAGGTATAGTDFTGTVGNVQFADGATTASISVPILPDIADEPNETFIIDLGSPTGGATLGSVTAHTVTILDDDEVQVGPGSLAFAGFSTTVAENAGVISIPVNRTGGSTGTVSVAFTFNLVLGSGSIDPASKGNDYQSAQGTLTFAEGEQSKVIVIAILDDNTIENSERFSITLSSPTGGATLGSFTNHTVTITDDDPNPNQTGPGTIRFLTTTSSTDESPVTGLHAITLQRVGGSTGSVRISYVVQGITATVGTDFILANGTITLGDGVVSTDLVFPITDDNIDEATETFTITLAVPTDGLILGQPAVHTVTITDDDTFVPVAAAYTGTVNSLAVPALRGSVVFKTTAKGAISGKFISGGKSRSFKGVLSSAGFEKVFIERVNGVPVTRTLNLQLNVDTFTGTYNDGNATASIAGFRNQVGTSKLPVAAFGYYTGRLNGNVAGVGDVLSPIFFRIAPTGSVKITGTLPDGTKIAAATAVSVQGRIPVGPALYKKKDGSLLGDLTTHQTGSRPIINGTLLWNAPVAATVYHPAGLPGTTLTVDSRLFLKPARGIRVVDLFDTTAGVGTFEATGGGLGTPLVKAFTLSTANKVVVTTRALDKLAVALSTSAGSVSGTFVDVAAGNKKRKIAGVILQPADGLPASVEGYFLGESTAGMIKLRP